MRKLRGLYVEDCRMTYLLVQRTLRHYAYIRNAPSKEVFLEETGRPLYDFLILDGDIVGWPMEDYISCVLNVQRIPSFIFSGSNPSALTPLLEVHPKAVVKKTDGVQILSQAVLSFFYAQEPLRERRIRPTR